MDKNIEFSSEKIDDCLIVFHERMMVRKYFLDDRRVYNFSSVSNSFCIGDIIAKTDNLIHCIVTLRK